MIYKTPASVFPVRGSSVNKTSRTSKISINNLARNSGIAKAIIKEINGNRLSFKESALPEKEFKFSLEKQNNIVRVVAKYWLPNLHVETSRVYPVATVHNNGKLQIHDYLGFDSLLKLTNVQKKYLESTMKKLFSSPKVSANEASLKKLHEPMIFPEQRPLKKAA